MIKHGRGLALTPTGRRNLPNGMSVDVARVLRAHGYRVDGAALLEALRRLTHDTNALATEAAA